LAQIIAPQSAPLHGTFVQPLLTLELIGGKGRYKEIIHHRRRQVLSLCRELKVGRHIVIDTGCEVELRGTGFINGTQIGVQTLLTQKAVTGVTLSVERVIRITEVVSQNRLGIQREAEIADGTDTGGVQV